MFKSITIKNGPIHAGRQFIFTRGETAVVGPNGCGKSLLAEYMAFALFGTVALRGKVTDYKGLDVSVKISIKGVDYQIDRDTKNCKLMDSNGEVICLGTKPCNIKIIALLGYDYNVYKMGNYAGQLDILGLGKLKPSERKTALDRTLGIGIIDKLIKYANDVALKNQHESEALKSILVDPGEEPVPPTCYKEGVLKELYDQYMSVNKQIEEYKSFQKMERPVPPSKPNVPEIANLVDDTSSKFLEKVLRRNELETEELSLQSIPSPTYTEEFLDIELQKCLNYERYENYLKSIQPFQDKEPDYTQEELNVIEINLSVWKHYDEDLSAYNLQEVSCPQCGNVFNPYKKEPVKPTFDRPSIDSKTIQTQKELLAKKVMRERIEVVGPVEKPKMSVSEIYNQINMIKNYERAQERLKQIKADFSGLEIYTQKNLSDLQQFEKECSVYHEKMTNWRSLSAKYDEMFQKYSDFNLHIAEVKSNELAVYYDNVKKYEERKRDYDRRYADYKNIHDKIVEMEKQEVRYKTAVDNLKTMKLKIKGYVLPSLQRVSSILLSEMSDGLFQKIEIDPDFNILVEGREIGLFSGSEQAMINLALRLGLGQVLTHRAFSVFIGDEIDASMRDDRARLTADCLRKISKYINQVILISHRDIEADHFINLGDI